MYTQYEDKTDTKDFKLYTIAVWNLKLIYLIYNKEPDLSQ